ncbi:hypothetical protein ILUMI_24506 [Ignelater luminosus]|uniref:Caspase-8 n=1 Tax=Ignelater luminosus TaxID=2038154 RepID=A0A8K0C6Y5_IGNLU|nr:hypothetical protein ILUMI_24506 [Ignelater luminosus]
MYFLYWASIGYISNPENLKDIYSALEIMAKHNTVKSREGSSVTIRSLKIDPTFMSAIYDYSFLNKTSKRITHNDEDCYRLDPKCPGVCLIINQESFYTEPDSRWKDLLPGPEKTLDERIGTNVDRDKLEKTFKKLGFKVEIRNNLTHFEVVPTIEDVISQVPKDSSFIVCILSHGLEGKIYGVNSIPIEVKEIREAMCKYNVNLNGQPKVLILQSCQGDDCQQVPNEDTQENDGGQGLQIDGYPSTTSVIPLTVDMHVFWATVPGFSALRDKIEGSWFIQSLCQKIEEKAERMHYQEICTMVIKDILMNKQWPTEKGVRKMVPLEESTLSKLFYLSSD